jgi:hypothetical protein
MAFSRIALQRRTTGASPGAALELVEFTSSSSPVKSMSSSSKPAMMSS